MQTRVGSLKAKRAAFKGADGCLAGGPLFCLASTGEGLRTGSYLRTRIIEPVPGRWSCLSRQSLVFFLFYLSWRAGFPVCLSPLSRGGNFGLPNTGPYTVLGTGRS